MQKYHKDVEDFGRYVAELGLTRAALAKCMVSTQLIHLVDFASAKVDGGICDMLGVEENVLATALQLGGAPLEGTIYHFTDVFGSHYQYMLLPDTTDATLLVIGPYLKARLTKDKIDALAARLGLKAEKRKVLERQLSTRGVLGEDSHAHALIDAFFERLLGEGYDVVTLNDSRVFTIPQKTGVSEDEALLEREMTARRYEFENQMLDAVAKGQHIRVEHIIAGFSELSFDQRSADPLRNMKNYAIIMNTLLRKAAERGGVHPFYLDRVSGDFSVKIEESSSLVPLRDLMKDMFRTYCNLVQTHSTSKYSPQVMKAITYIDYDLSAPLTLSKIAEKQKISPPYLSGIFKRETGETVTEYINRKRIELAKRLLVETKLQVQSIAQQCGIMDVHYFSKLFKRLVGLTPLEYRQAHT